MLMKALLRCKRLLGARGHAFSAHAAKRKRHRRGRRPVPTAAHSAHLASSPLTVKSIIEFIISCFMTCSAVVLICPVKDEAGEQLSRLEFPPVPPLPSFFQRASDFTRRVEGWRGGWGGLVRVVGAVSTANQLLKVAMQAEAEMRCQMARLATSLTG